MTVRVGVILDRKGNEVFTVRPETTVAQAAESLREHNVGALVVTTDGDDVVGILSERDIVRQLAEEGGECLRRDVRDVMSTEVTTCQRDQTADDLMAIMTESRIRHVPVIEDGRMIGIVSIGDVVKSRMDELETKAEALEDYVSGSHH